MTRILRENADFDSYRYCFEEGARDHIRETQHVCVDTSTSKYFRHKQYFLEKNASIKRTIFGVYE